ncbi:hypothetical protein U1Q18_004603, partial [Sarracenia purpurea var. burkii]
HVPPPSRSAFMGHEVPFVPRQESATFPPIKGTAPMALIPHVHAQEAAAPSAPAH